MITTAVMLTNAELDAFLDILELPTASSFSYEGTLTGPDEQIVAARLQNGRQSLISRGLLTVDEQDEAIADDTLLALAGAAALPEATAAFTWIGRDRNASPHYFNATSRLFVEHMAPQTDIHVFSYVPDQYLLQRRASSLFTRLVGGIANGEHEILLPAEAFLALIAMVDESNVTAIEELAAGSCSPDLVTQLAADSREGSVLLGVVAWGLRDPEPEGGRMLVGITAENRCWLAENAADDPSRLRIRRVTGAECQTAFLSLLEPLVAARAAG